MTDDPETPGANSWEINFAVTTEIDNDRSTIEAPLADFNYGVGARIELTYEIPLTLTGVQGQALQTGLDTSMAGVKYRFVDLERSGIAVSTYPQFFFPAPVPSSLRTATTQQNGVSSFLLPVEIEKHIGAFAFNEEVGYLFQPTPQNQWMIGSSVSYPLTSKTLLLAEVHGFMTSNFNDEEMVFNLGGEVQIDSKHVLLLSTGHSLLDFQGDSPSFMSYLGMQFLL